MKTAPSPVAASELLTAEQVSSEFGIALSTLANWRSTRRVDLPFVKIGSRVRYRRSDLQAFIERRVVA